MSRYQHKPHSLSGPNKGSAWTPQEDLALLAEVERGMTNIQIAEVHGRSRVAVDMRRTAIELRRGRAKPPHSAPVAKTTHKVVIGCKYTGKHAGAADTSTGVYWEVLADVTEDALKIQLALLKPRTSWVGNVQELLEKM